MHAEALAADPRLGVADLAACRRLMRGGSKSFFAASLLLPARVRAPATALYAFCRIADDAIDLGDDPLDAMHGLQQRLDAIYAQRPWAIDADRALACVVHQHAVPRALLDALLEGFVWDAAGRRYETVDDLEAYGARVAGTVGAMMTLVMGVRDPAALARACELGVAMQFTNIARDVGEDARNGRVYLPLAWLREAGIDPDAWLREPIFTPSLGAVVARLLERAEALYERADTGIALLPRDCRPAIRAASLVYGEIGRQLAREGLDSVRRRVVVPGSRKVALMVRATTARAPSAAPAAAAPPLPTLRFLVDAVPPTARAPGVARPQDFVERVGWVIELFERQAAARRAMN